MAKQDCILSTIEDGVVVVLGWGGGVIILFTQGTANPAFGPVKATFPPSSMFNTKWYDELA